MKKQLYLVLFFLSFSGMVLGAKRYAAPNGSASNTGTTPESPWSLSFALGNTSGLTPGDSLILLDGIYEGNFISAISGSSENPIYILPANEGKAIIDVSKNRTSGTGLTVNGTYTWIIGIHVTSSTLIRKSDASNGNAEVLYESGIAVFGDNNKLINCWVYDVVGGGLELWRSGLNLEVYGSVIFNNGSQSDTRGTGHGMYIQHERPDQPKVIENNFIFQNASQGINIYTTNPKNSGIIARKNVSFNTGVMATFNQFLFRPPHNLTIGSQSNESFDMTIEANLFYSDLQGGRLTTSLVSNVTLGRTYSPNRDMKFNENILFGGGNMVELQPLSGLTLQRNKLFNVHGNFFAFVGNPASFPNSTWDLNAYNNLANTSKPFQGLNFSEWKSSFSPFDAGSTFTISPSSSREVLITQNKYDPLRFHVSILSFSDSELIALDFSEYEEFKGAEYEIRDIQNPFDPSQKTTGTFGGSTISFPMNWTKSLQPKGNMPNPVVHTDLTFGTFLLTFKELVQSFPEVRDSVSLILSNAGTAKLAPENFLASQPNEPYTYSSPAGFDFDCTDLGENKISITLKNSRTGDEKTVQVSVWVVDDIAPIFDAANGIYLFDPVVGKIALSVPDFDIVDIIDNCVSSYTVSLSKTEITCADIYQNPESPVWEFPVIITLTDLSGNAFSKTVKAIIGNVIESKKVSITQTGQLAEGNTVELTLGNELVYTVSGWLKDGELIPNEIGKTLKVSEEGRYLAMLVLESGCSVSSSQLEVISSDWPTPKSQVNLILSESGTGLLEPSDLFETWPVGPEGLVFDLSRREFSCENLGENQIVLTLRKASGESRDFPVTILVKDETAPTLVTKLPNLAFDLTKGELILNPEDFVASLSDNCDLKSLTLNKNRISCEDYDLPIELILTAVDQSGNTASEILTVSVSAFESKKISISPESGTEFLEGESAEIRLGDEYGFTLIGWYRNGELIQGEKGKAILTEQSGTYWAKLISNDGGCEVESQKTEIKFTSLPFGDVKESLNLILGPEGNADLGPSDVFVTWPLTDPSLEVTLSKTIFTCEDIGEKVVTILIKNQAGQTWEESIQVLVKDQTPPVLVPKNITLDLDVTKGILEITPEQVLEEFSDNCGIKSLTITKDRFTCEDIGKEFSIAIRAEDNSGNVSESVSKVKIERLEAEPVAITGQTSYCQGESGVLELSSAFPFEVVRWRRNGTEIPGQTGKTLTVTESGVYHAVIRYQGGCLSESKELEVKVNPVPIGEITVDGNILRAPEGNFAYQWFRNGEKLESETGRIFTAQLMGEYAVELTSEAGCSQRLKSVTLAISGLLGRPVIPAKQLKIYPNPASDRVTVEFPDGILATQPNISIYSSDGKNVTSMVVFTILNDTEVEISVNRLAKGTYHISAINPDQKSFFAKLIIIN
ncbi:T9SS type A sorting domain-containing protein [Algoriphagus litoralis]|uniref:T9SS type A sorting domain-containing protein n=1 Tax=Algoriphagus litoralis TaxID=2202829 RepID=UPI000DB9C0B9|nr:T9SS type A sorting domain-containing protein [Algoriphagus litoralis]